MAESEVDIQALKDMLHSARVIIEERNLYNIWDRIPTSNDPDFTKDSFKEYIKQGLYFRTYDKWSEKLEDIFLENNLDFLRFKMECISGDARKTSKEPAYIFVKKVRELDRIVSDKILLASYTMQIKQSALWHPVEYKDGVISQGNRVHTFKDVTYIKLLDTLWDRRRIETPSGTVVLATEKPITRTSLNKKIGINSHDRFAHIVTGIRKAMKSKHINLQIKYPDRVFICVQQTKK